MNFNDNMNKKELSSYYENRLVTNRKKINQMIEELNDKIKEYNNSLEYSNSHDINIALKYSFDYLTEIKLKKK
jgi:uncharacterized FlaG/YvyC family protein